MVSVPMRPKNTLPYAPCPNSAPISTSAKGVGFHIGAALVAPHGSLSSDCERWVLCFWGASELIAPLFAASSANSLLTKTAKYNPRTSGLSELTGPCVVTITSTASSHTFVVWAGLCVLGTHDACTIILVPLHFWQPCKRSMYAPEPYAQHTACPDRAILRGHACCALPTEMSGLVVQCFDTAARAPVRPDIVTA